MTDTSSPGVGTPRIPAQSPPEPTGWVGWIIFAAVIMLTVGILHVIEGFVALFEDTYYVVGDRGLVVSVDYTAWGWVHIVAGLIIAGAGAGLFSGRMWARIVGVLVALLSILLSFTFIAAYPVWGAMLIALDILVVYALTVHGSELKPSF
jgi:hypothetical protein